MRMSANEKFNVVIDNTSTVAPDPFNVAALRLPPSFAETAGVKKMLTTVPVRKPHRQEWIRVHDDAAYRGDFATIHLKGDGGEFYLVHPDLVASLQPELTLVTIYTVINKQNVVYLWPARLVTSDGRRNSDGWATSSHEAAAAAMKRLTRVSANLALGAYEHSFTDNPIPDADPVWPELGFDELLRIGFEKTGRFVKDFNHPVIKQLRGL
jgi:hypothetical protein